MEPWDEYEPSKTQITGIRKDIKRFNKLANQLNLTLTKVQVGMDGKKRDYELPKELTQKSEYLCRAMQNIASKQSSL